MRKNKRNQRKRKKTKRKTKAPELKKKKTGKYEISSFETHAE